MFALSLLLAVAANAPPAGGAAETLVDARCLLFLNMFAKIAVEQSDRDSTKVIGAAGYYLGRLSGAYRGATLAAAIERGRQSINAQDGPDFTALATKEGDKCLATFVASLDAADL